MIRRSLLHVSFALMVVGSASQLSATEKAPPRQLTDAEYLRLLDTLRPADDEAWRTIPWKISVLDAQRTAAEQNKPIFIWAMDGHPLGCT